MRRLLFILSLIVFSTPLLTAQQAEINLMPRIQGNDITYYAVIQDFRDMVGFQFSLNWDTEAMAYEQMRFRDDMKYAMFNDKKAGKGFILASWFSEKMGGVTLERCDTLFTVQFKKKKELADLKFSSDPLQIEMINTATQRLPLRSKVISDCGVLSTDGGAKDRFDFRLYPTLTSTGAPLRMITDFKKSLHIQIYDLGGQLVLDRKLEGSRQFAAPASSGVYILKVISDDQVIHSEKFIVQ